MAEASSSSTAPTIVRPAHVDESTYGAMKEYRAVCRRYLSGFKVVRVLTVDVESQGTRTSGRVAETRSAHLSSAGDLRMSEADQIV